MFFFRWSFQDHQKNPQSKTREQNPTMSAKQTQFVGLWVLGRCEQHENPPMNVNLVIHGGIWIILLTQYEQVQSWVIGESFLPKIGGKNPRTSLSFHPGYLLQKV